MSLNRIKRLHRDAPLLLDSPRDVEGLVENAPSEMADQQNYGCGCYWFVKLHPDEPGSQR